MTVKYRNSRKNKKTSHSRRRKQRNMTRNSTNNWPSHSPNIEKPFSTAAKDSDYSNNSLSKEDGKKWLRELKNRSSCYACTENHPAVLEFHHVRAEDKKGTLSHLARKGASLKHLEDELAKCVCLCSNCHKKVHSGDLVLLNQPKLAEYTISRVWHPN